MTYVDAPTWVEPDTRITFGADNEDELTLIRQAREALHNLNRETSWIVPDDDTANGYVPGIAPFSYNEADADHDKVAESNYHVALRELEGLSSQPPEVTEVTIRHWVGGVPMHFLVFNTLDDEAVTTLADLVRGYEDYPVLDDVDLTEREDAELETALTFYDDVPDEETAGKVISWLGERDEWPHWPDELPEEDRVREALLDLGLVDPDPERGEEPLTSIEETVRLFADIDTARNARLAGV